MESSDVRVLKECPTLPPQYSVLEGCRSSLHNVEKGDRAFIGIPVPQHVDHTAHIYIVIHGLTKSIYLCDLSRVEFIQNLGVKNILILNNSHLRISNERRFRNDKYPPPLFFKCTLFICNTLSDCSVKIIYYLGKKGTCLPPQTYHHTDVYPRFKTFVCIWFERLINAQQFKGRGHFINANIFHYRRFIQCYHFTTMFYPRVPYCNVYNNRDITIKHFF